MKRVALLLNDMITHNIITNCAIFGPIAQMRYTEAVATMDVDVLVAAHEINGLNVLEPIYNFCGTRGWRPEGEAIRVGSWPVQFIPAFDPVTREAMRLAEIGEIEGVPLRVVRADYLAIIALSVGRAKDFVRILALLENNSVKSNDIEKLARNFGLQAKWLSFKEKFLDA